MEVTDTDNVATMDAMLDRGQWLRAVEFYRALPSRAAKDDRATRVRLAIALIRSGKVQSGIKLFGEIEHVAPERAMLLAMVVKELMRAKRHDDATAVLDKMIASGADSIEELRLRASLHGRDKRFEPALRDARRLLTLDPCDWPGHAALLKLLVQAGQITAAADHATSLGTDAANDIALTQMVILSLKRDGREDAIVPLAEAIEAKGVTTPQAAAAVVAAYVEAGLPAHAEAAGEKYASLGVAGGKLDETLAQAMIESEDQTPERLDKIIDMMRNSKVADGRDPRALRKMGFALLRAGREREAVPVLAKALKLAPNSNGIRALYARALRQSERYEEAAEQFKQLLPSHPEAHNFHRYAAGALSLAGKKDEAAALFDNFIDARRSRMSDSFEAGFDNLWSKVDKHKVPAANLEWAWSLRKDKKDDRAEWERRAKWGYLADQYIIDWIECRDDQIHEAMLKLADLDQADQALSKIDKSRGVILASAHIGPMFAGPLALELLGIESRWIASTPGSVRTAYGRRLISTSDQTGAEVARQTLRTLGEGKAVVIAIDGAIALSAPRVPFEGQHITMSSFAPRLVHRLGTPSMFVAPRWENNKIGFVVEPMPAPEPGEDVNDYVPRWQAAFLDYLREFLSGEPENLRLAGGVWRHIRMPENG
ncbi:tetratricopeptide repeat protein [Croceicoccus ponticola]|uniref:tetratricopeptide repeat protein n=1 Tax=Croceicoccus ponticola TaxID=2217664 RepID=UPI0013E2B748|nr:tetratricopeptide repeat protein [Croceicoccus ponticola]